jgi:S1-C subfamily serine protease
MKRIVLRHLSGSKANQVEEFPLNHFEELTIGRDPSSTVKFDPDKDDLVGRQHAKIVREGGADSKQFVISDVGSRNGTYVNKERILGPVNITPGDVVQFGPGGPEFQFDLEPRPEGLARATRIATDPTAVTALKSQGPPTRVASAGNGGNGNPSESSASSGGAARPAVGKTTVMRMIAETKGESKKHTFIVAAALLVLVGAVVGGSVYWVHKRSAETAAAAAAATEQQVNALGGRTSKVEDRTAAMTASEVAAAYTDATVFVQVSWSLIQTSSGNPLFAKYIPNKYKCFVCVDKDNKAKFVEKQIIPDGREWVAAYKVVESSRGNVVEPYLTTDNKPDGNSIPYPVGFSLTGSGFTVTNDGFILTNLHVAENWKIFYHFQKFAIPGVIVNNDGTPALDAQGQPQMIQQLQWIPAETKQFGESQLGNPAVSGRDDSLFVTFPKTELRIPAVVKRSSDRHDVSMIKIDIPEPLKKVELNDNYDTIKPGDVAIVLGYPGGSPNEVTVINSKGVGGWYQNQQVGIVPNATLSVGNIARILRGQEGGQGKDLVVSLFGDIYQLTINSTGGGNSGGPVFDDKGHVIALYTYGLGSDFQASGAVPIRYAKELMGVTPTMK